MLWKKGITREEGNYREGVMYRKYRSSLAT